MACRVCHNVSRLTLRHGARDVLDSYHTTTSRALRACAPSISSIQSRRIHQSRSSRQAEQKPPSGEDNRFLARDLALQLAKRASKATQGSYAVYGASELIYKYVASQADYNITQAERDAEKVTLGPDGEEIGTSSGGMWHDGSSFLSSVFCQVTDVLTRMCKNRLQAPRNIQHMVASNHASPLPPHRAPPLSRQRPLPKLASPADRPFLPRGRA